MSPDPPKNLHLRIHDVSASLSVKSMRGLLFFFSTRQWLQARSQESRTRNDKVKIFTPQRPVRSMQRPYLQRAPSAPQLFRTSSAICTGTFGTLMNYFPKPSGRISNLHQNFPEPLPNHIFLRLYDPVSMFSLVRNIMLYKTAQIPLTGAKPIVQVRQVRNVKLTVEPFRLNQESPRNKKQQQKPRAQLTTVPGGVQIHGSKHKQTRTKKGRFHPQVERRYVVTCIHSPAKRSSL